MLASSWVTLKTHYCNNTRNWRPRSTEDTLMTALAQLHWATTNFWISSTLCRISIPQSNSPTRSLKSQPLSWTWKSPWNKENNTTSVHYKLTDSHSYLDYHSSYNPSTKNSIPFSQFPRLCCLPSDDAGFEEKAEKMVNFFLQTIPPKNGKKKLSTNSDPFPDEKRCNPTAEQPLKRDRSWVSFTTPRLSVCTKSSCWTGVSCRHALRWPRSLANHHWSHTNETLSSETCWCDWHYSSRPPKHQEPLLATKRNAKRAPSSASMSAFKDQNPRWTSPESVRHVFYCTKFAKLCIGETGHTLNTRFEEHLADIKHHRDKPVANHLNQGGCPIHNIHVKELWLLFTDNASDRKDMESHLIDKFGSRRPSRMNEKL